MVGTAFSTIGDTLNSLTTAELKRRGMAAIEEGLRRGPVHLIKRNKASAVVLSARDYARLAGGKSATQVGMTAAEWLVNLPVKGSNPSVNWTRRYVASETFARDRVF